MATPLVLAMALAFGGCDASSPHYEVYVTACQGFKCSDADLARLQSLPTSKNPIGDPMIPFQLGKITYSSDHKPVKHELLSPVQSGMAYIDVDLKQGRALFATQGAQNVDTYVIDINSSSAAAPAQPQVLIGDRSGLLAPCKNKTLPGAIGGCTNVNTFFARWPRTSGDEIIFAFEAWTKLGDLAMAQGLAAVKADGTGARILTHDASVCPYAACDGTKPPELGFSDRCPLALPGGRVVFTRSYNQGLYTRVGILDLKTGNVTIPETLPHFADKSGCPSADASGERFIYMGCTGEGPKGTCMGSSSNGNTTYSYGSVSVSDPSEFVPTFAVPLINAPSWLGTYASTQCNFDRPSLETISCLGATPKSNSVLKLGVDQKTGSATAVEDMVPTTGCMSAECFQAYLVESPEEDVDGMTVVV